MRVAVLSPFVDRRHGTERSLAEIVERLAKRHGHEIHLYSQRVDDLPVALFATREQNSSQQIFWHRVPRLPAPHLFAFLFWMFANQFCRLSDRWFRHLRFDAVFSPGINSTDADLILVHVVFHRLTELQQQRSSEGLRGIHRSLYYRLLCFLENRIYRRKELRLAAVSMHTARQLAQYFGRRDALVVPNGVDPTFFAPASRLALRDAARRKLGYLPGDILLLLVGNDWRNKGLPTLLEAMSRLSDPSLRLSVVGSDAAAEFLPKVQSLHLSDRVKFFAESSEILPFYVPRTFMQRLRWKIHSTCLFWRPWLVACPCSSAAWPVSANILQTVWTEFFFRIQAIQVPLPHLFPCCSSSRNFVAPLEKPLRAKPSSFPGTAKRMRFIAFFRVRNPNHKTPS